MINECECKKCFRLYTQSQFMEMDGRCPKCGSMVNNAYEDISCMDYNTYQDHIEETHRAVARNSRNKTIYFEEDPWE